MLLVVLAALLSLFGIPGRWLWLDELLSANFSAEGPWATLVTVLRFDVHPPLYYLQLSLWMLPWQDDAWLMTNSVLWHGVAVALLAWAAAGRYGPRVGLGAGLLLAVSPAALAYADQVRMYAFIMAMIVWVWHAQTRWLEGRGGRMGWLWIALSQVAVTNSHTAGLLMLSGCVTLGAVTVMQQGRGRMLRWLAIELLVLVLSLLPLLIGMMRGVTHLAVPGTTEVLEVLRFLAGAADAPLPVAILLSLAILGGLVAAALRDRLLARDALTLILLPLLLAALLSYLHRPVWIERIFVPVLPFICLCLARACLRPVTPIAAVPGTLQDELTGRGADAERTAVRDQTQRRIGPALLLALAVIWLGLDLRYQIPRSKGDGFRLAAEAVQQQAVPGDTILFESDFSYWCFLWYFKGPDWGSPRQAFIMNADWARVMQRLPPVLTPLLGLGENDRTRLVNGVTTLLWDRQQPMPAIMGGQLFRLRGPDGAVAPIPGRRLVARQQYRQLVLEQWAPES
ncbi:hypothetical protein [Pararoseomonas baculiformis]|nr:hypothetical protein [Pararoseomonas baculiformis]